MAGGERRERRKKTKKKRGSGKVTKSPRKKTAAEIHKEKFGDTKFKKRLNFPTRAQQFEEDERKKFAKNKKLWLKTFNIQFKRKYGDPLKNDLRVRKILQKQFDA